MLRPARAKRAFHSGASASKAARWYRDAAEQGAGASAGSAGAGASEIRGFRAADVDLMRVPVRPGGEGRSHDVG